MTPDRYFFAKICAVKKIFFLFNLLYHETILASQGKSRGGNALSLLEVKEPRGSLCIFAYFLYIRK